MGRRVKMNTGRGGTGMIAHVGKIASHIWEDHDEGKPGNDCDSLRDRELRKISEDFKLILACFVLY
jgi:hypothetical protein